MSNDLERNTHGEQQRGGGVAKFMHAPTAQTGRNADPWHGLSDGFGIERHADGRGEHDALRFSPDCRLLPMDPRSAAPTQVPSLRR
jgi:hypothetical protein